MTRIRRLRRALREVLDATDVAGAAVTTRIRRLRRALREMLDATMSEVRP